MAQFDNKLASFLSHDVKIHRSSSYSVNDYGEVIPNTEAVIATTKMRIEPTKSKGLTTTVQGREVDVTHKGFAISTEDVQENDRIEIVSTSTEYLVLLVNPYYDESTLDHFELYLKEISRI